MTDQRGDARATPAGGRSITAWVVYEAGGSALVVLAASTLLPRWFAGGPGDGLASAGQAEQLVGRGLLVAVVMAASAALVVGIWSDLTGRRRVPLAAAVAVGVVAVAATGATGGWAATLVVLAIARGAAVVAGRLHDAMLPAVAATADRAAISAGGQAFASLGAAALLAAGLAVHLLDLPVPTPTAWWPPVVVAAWWAVLTVPVVVRGVDPPRRARLLVRVPARAVLRDLSDLPARLARSAVLGRTLVATAVVVVAVDVLVVLGAAAGTDVGLDGTALVVALLAVHLVAVPHVVLFGRLATDGARGRGRVGTYLVASIVVVPLVGIGVGRLGPPDLVGRVDGVFAGTEQAVGQGPVLLAARGGPGVRPTELAPDLLGAAEPQPAVVVTGLLEIDYVGQDVVVTHAAGPGDGTLRVLVDDGIAQDVEGRPVVVDADQPRARYGLDVRVVVPQAGPHRLTLVATAGPVTVSGVDVQGPRRQTSWPLVAGLLVALPLLALAVSTLAGRSGRGRLARLDTRRAAVVAMGGLVVALAWAGTATTVVEFWALVWLVAVVAGGARALLRALYVDLAPPGRVGEATGVLAMAVAAVALVVMGLVVAATTFGGGPRTALVGVALVVVGAVGLVGWDAVVDAPPERRD